MGRMLRHSDGPAVVSVDSRGAPRITLTLRTAKLTTPSGEFLCLVRDVSQTGFKARLFHPLPDDDRFEFEVGNGATYAVDPVWERDSHAGFRFVDPPDDLHALLSEHGGFHRRHLRLGIHLAAWVRTGPDVRPVELDNISQSGAMIRSEIPLAVGARVTLGAPSLGEIEAQVCWRRAFAHGLVFASIFRFDEMALLADRLRRGDEAAAESCAGRPQARPETPGLTFS